MKVALVTGGAKGIGAGIVKVLAKKYYVIINYLTSEKEALSLQEKVKQNGGFSECYKCDITNFDETKKMVDYVLKKFGRIDCLVNNAGISESKLFTDETMQEYSRVINTNLNSAIYLTKLVAPSMISHNEGKIINVSSIWGVVGGSMEVSYSVSKAGLIGFTKALAKELALSNIQVNAIAPGAIDTDMMKEYSDEDVEEFCKTVPMGRLGSVAEVACIIKLLIDEDSSFITGQVFGSNGGLVM
jgi:3-oxoacyl-[acyl-carrier protein] reductase